LNAEYESDEEWEECDSDNDENNNNNQNLIENDSTNCEMDVEKQESFDKNFEEKAEYIEKLKSLIRNRNLVESLLKMAEIGYEKIDHIDHIYNSLKLIQYEALDCYLYILHGVYLIDKPLNYDDCIKVEHMLKLLKYVALRPVEDFAADSNKQSSFEHLLKIVDLIHELFVYFNGCGVKADAQQTNTISIAHKLEIVNIIREIFIKYKTTLADLCIKLSRVLALMSIKERDAGFNMQKEIIQV
jgi:hypothetical protein